MSHEHTRQQHSCFYQTRKGLWSYIQYIKLHKEEENLREFDYRELQTSTGWNYFPLCDSRMVMWVRKHHQHPHYYNLERDKLADYKFCASRPFKSVLEISPCKG